MPNQFTLRKKLILGGILAIIVPSLIAGIIITLRLANSLQEIFEQKATLTAKNMARITTLTLEKEIDFASYIAVDNRLVELTAEKKYALATKHVKTIYKKVKTNYLSVMIADTSGIIRADIEHDSVHIDVSDRQYFLQARKGSFGIEGPFISRLDQRHIMAISYPIAKGSEFLGVLIIALEMNYLVDMVSSTRIDRSGYAFMTDNSGNIIVHPEKDIVFKVNVYHEAGIKRFAEKLMKGSAGSGVYTYKGVKKIAGFTHMKLTGWNVIFTQNRNEIMKPVNAIIIFILIIGGLFFFFSIAIITIVFPKISSPAQKAMDLLQELIAHSENVIMIIGLDHKIMYVNPATEKMFKRCKGEFINTEPILENVNNTSSEAIWSELQSGHMWTGNVVFNTLGPEPMMLAVMIIPVVNVSGEVENYLEIGRDITEEQRIQKRLVQTQKMEALGAMAGGIAHDFNNILSAIFAFTECSLMVPGNPLQTQENLKMLLTASERARDLVSQILTFSRKTQQELRPLAPKLIIKEAIKLLRASIPVEIELRTSIVSEAMIMAEPIQIHQIVVNICTNAVHAIGAKPGCIDVILEDIIVDEEFARSHPGLQMGKKHILLKIADSGKGIEKDILDRIFEPFFTTKPVGEGTGLGLSVVHGIVQKLKGCITVYSNVGKGTVFNIIIPSLTTEMQEGDQSVTVITGGNERILFIDDEKAIVKPLENILTNLGYHVSKFTDSIEALNTFRQNPDLFDLVITDYSMPRMTGIEIVENIRKIRSDIRIIVNSGYMTREITEHFTKMGVHSILSKPVNTYQLADAIRKAFNTNT